MNTTTLTSSEAALIAAICQNLNEYLDIFFGLMIGMSIGLGIAAICHLQHRWCIVIQLYIIGFLSLTVVIAVYTTMHISTYVNPRWIITLFRFVQRLF